MHRLISMMFKESKQTMTPTNVKPFNLKSDEGKLKATEFLGHMVKALPVGKRNDWLEVRGWSDLGIVNHRRVYRSPMAVKPVSTMNQTDAVEQECWALMESKGLIVRR